ncbi:zinc C3HC4 type family [Micractinium conductrix]|uniref:Zinc C3HC4 type family n=1 Tax=Micractinium conductrix TaxID=554055 RepID=A0A2P6VP65_9CHLO|nr:zinc C3HC4 type family [Micractinium conductrix]|eukprot:PSC75855.1 zinc C3HC4 type family [Micractinium conductrix]
MTTLLRQARRSGFSAGVASAAVLYVSTKTYFWRVFEETAEQLPGAEPRVAASAAAEASEPLFSGAAERAWAARRWNEAVDVVFKPAVEALARRNL